MADDELDIREQARAVEQRDDTPSLAHVKTTGPLSGGAGGSEIPALETMLMMRPCSFSNISGRTR